MGDPKTRPKEQGGLADSEPGRAYATTELGVGLGHGTPMPDGGPSGAGVPTPAIVRDGEQDDEGPDPLLGKVLGGHYRIETRIGEGGMGTVYKALHVQLEKHFAIKVLSKKIAENVSAVERLRQEAQAASRIDHDNIVDVTHFDATEDGDVFIVMELLKGAPLADVLERGRLDLPNAMHIALQMCRALHAAHEHNIVHRDLKPENIFIVPKNGMDFVKVLDFGISMIKSADTEQVRMTKTGQLVGTPLYMSPEQAKGESDVDRRVDVYALGVILYEMLAGTPPFEGDNYFQLLWKHGNDMPDPPSLRAPDAHIPEAIEAAIMKALAKDPADRFATMADFEVALLEGAPDLQVTGPLLSMPSMTSMTSMTPTALARPAAPGRRGLVLVLVAAALVFAGIGAFALGGDETGGEPADPIPPTRVEPVDDPPPDELPNGIDVPDPPATPDPELVWVEFVSRPRGATVRVAGQVLGPTPTQARFPASDEPLEAIFELRGYRSEAVPVGVAEGARVEASLRRVRPHGGGNGTSPPIKMVF